MQLTEDMIDRLCWYPVKNREAWEYYINAISSFWVPAHVDLSSDIGQWRNLSNAERRFLSKILAFFAASDTIVNENLIRRFVQDVTDPAYLAFYEFQIGMEVIHTHQYNEIIHTYFPESEEKKNLFRAIQTEPYVEKKAQWALDWIESDRSYPERLIAFACVEGIMFSSSFCAIYWIKNRGLLPGLAQANEYIARDEGMHTDFACLVYNQSCERLPEDKVHEIVSSAVEVEIAFVKDALAQDLLGMNAKSMSQYVQFVADTLLDRLGYRKLYYSQNPYKFMERLSLLSKGNFFENRVNSYQKGGGSENDEDKQFRLDANF